MKAAVTIGAGDPDQIHIREVPNPASREGWVLIRIKAFGLNRSELFTRQGHSPGVSFPRIQGIECVGIVESDPSGTHASGSQVAAIMGGMGRSFDGSYAEFVSVPLKNVFPFSSTLPWDVLGAIPEMFQTVSGSLYEALEIRKGETLLIRGGTSSIGMLAARLAVTEGVRVIATTRKSDRTAVLLENGASEVVIDEGRISEKVRDLHPEGVDKVLELVGTRTLVDSLKCIRPKGVVCMTGILGNEWTMKEFTPMGDIPSLGRLTVYMGDVENLSHERLDQFIKKVESGALNLTIDRVFTLDKVAEAHRYMESNQATGKIVVKVP